jgi:predicted phage terminase large subunit-like protein
LGEYRKYVKPEGLVERYSPEGLLDPVRMPRAVLDKMKEDLGQYGYGGQVGQHPVPPGGGMFQVGRFVIIDSTEHLLRDPLQVAGVVRYWDKAGTEAGGAYTAGVKMYKLGAGAETRFLITDVKRGQWASHIREDIIKATAQGDGREVVVYHEQEPGSGGKESAEATIRNLAGFVSMADRPVGDKVYRADPYSVQVNNGNVYVLRAAWTDDFIEEHRFYPFSTYKDQVDAASGAFGRLTAYKEVGTW